MALHGRDVTLIERDVLPRTVEPRKGVPQGRHLHVLLAAGLAALERLFPGLERELQAAGAVRVMGSREVGILGPAGWLPPLSEPLDMLAMSRDLLEAAVRERVRATPRVRILDGRTVVGLRVERGAVAGAIMGNGEVVEAPLVVDAAGRGSDAPSWLQACGYPEPPETVVDPHLGYATRIFRGSPALPQGWRMLFVMCRIEYPRAAVLAPLEGDRFIVSLAGAGACRPAPEEEGFLAFARSLRTPLLAEVIQRATPDGPIYGTRSTRNRWRHYERLGALPAGFVPFGDGMCAFNPAYGQGITVAALEAELLRDALAAGADPATLSRVLPRRFARVIETPWTMAVSQDTRVAGTDGPQTIPFKRVLDWYGDRMWELATVDPRMAASLLRVYHLLIPPTQLFRPGLVARVAAHRLASWRAPAVASPAAPDRAVAGD
jgi:2-polyprenyl-6-methoxyphenol hydroxylase-like FAD-dependent oxidoreductase